MINLLLVDDSKTIHVYVKSCMSENKEYIIYHAYNGEEGLEVLKKEKIDFVFLDWEMPIMDGPTTFSKIKELNLGIPAVMLTSRNEEKDIEQMLEAGVNDYLMKPFTGDILLSKLSENVHKEM